MHSAMIKKYGREDVYRHLPTFPQYTTNVGSARWKRVLLNVAEDFTDDLADAIPARGWLAVLKYAIKYGDDFLVTVIDEKLHKAGFIYDYTSKMAVMTSVLHLLTESNPDRDAIRVAQHLLRSTHMFKETVDEAFRAWNLAGGETSGITYAHYQTVKTMGGAIESITWTQHI